MNARLAEWDAGMPVDEDAFVFVAEPSLAAGRAPTPLVEPTSPPSRDEPAEAPRPSAAKPPMNPTAEIELQPRTRHPDRADRRRRHGVRPVVVASPSDERDAFDRRARRSSGRRRGRTWRLLQTARRRAPAPSIVADAAPVVRPSTRRRGGGRSPTRSRQSLAIADATAVELTDADASYAGASEGLRPAGRRRSRHDATGEPRSARRSPGRR